MSRTCNFSQEGMVSPVLMIMLADQSIENSYGQSIYICAGGVYFTERNGTETERSTLLRIVLHEDKLRSMPVF